MGSRIEVGRKVFKVREDSILDTIRRGWRKVVDSWLGDVGFVVGFPIAIMALYRLLERLVLGGV